MKTLVSIPVNGHRHAKIFYFYMHVAGLGGSKDCLLSLIELMVDQEEDKVHNGSIANTVIKGLRGKFTRPCCRLGPGGIWSDGSHEGKADVLAIASDSSAGNAFGGAEKERLERVSSRLSSERLKPEARWITPAKNIMHAAAPRSRAITHSNLVLSNLFGWKTLGFFHFDLGEILNSISPHSATI